MKLIEVASDLVQLVGTASIWWRRVQQRSADVAPTAATGDSGASRTKSYRPYDAR